MKTVLRKKLNGLYFGAPDRWVSNPRHARNFKSIDRALAFIEHWNLNDVEVAFAFPDGNAVVDLPQEKLRLTFSKE